MAHYKISDIAEEVKDRENNPAESVYDRFVGLEHYVSGDLEIIHFGSSKKLESAMKVFRAGDTLVARRNVYLKRASIVQFDGLTSGDSIVLRAKQPVMARILPFVLNTDDFWDYAEKYSDGTMSKRLSPKILMEYEFNISNDRLEDISEILWAANKTRNGYKKLLHIMDELVKSRFIEMFEGKDYPQKRLSDVCNKITDGTHKTPIYLNEGVVFISAKNIIDGKLNFEDIKYISEEEYQGIQKRCQIEKGDVLLTKSGSLGMTAIVETDEPLGLFESLAVLKYNRSLLKGIFLCTQMQSDAIQTQLMSNIKGVAVKHLHLNVISSTKVIVPPLDVQESFSLFVAQVDKSKLALQESLDKLENLQKALIKQYLC